MCTTPRRSARRSYVGTATRAEWCASVLSLSGRGKRKATKRLAPAAQLQPHTWAPVPQTGGPSLRVTEDPSATRTSESSTALAPRDHRQLQPGAAPERIQGARILVETKAMRQQQVAVDGAAAHQLQGALERVADGHRADDPQLLFVDAERRETSLRLVGRHAEQQDRAAAARADYRVLDRGDRTRRVDDGVP